MSAHSIVEMLSRGNRVGVSSHSHKAINNLLKAVEMAATDRGLRFSGIKKSSFEEQFLNGSMIEDTLDNKVATVNGHDLIAGTAWLFARPELDQQLDYLFIDEAGQVSLANTIAMGVCAKNVILVGDQMQLSQPIQGTHPGRSGSWHWSTCLTVPPQSHRNAGSSSARRDGCIPPCVGSSPMRSTMGGCTLRPETNGSM